MLLDISGKKAISTAPVSATSSSSRSNRLNWHPSQDASLNTPIRGFRPFLELTKSSHPMPHLRIGEHRTVLADEIGAHLAMAAESYRALHVAFHREINLIVGESSRFQLPDHETHHDLRTASHHCSSLGPQRCRPKKLGHYAYPATPARSTHIDRGQNLRIRQSAPSLELLGEQQF